MLFMVLNIGMAFQHGTGRKRYLNTKPQTIVNQQKLNTEQDCFCMEKKFVKIGQLKEGGYLLIDDVAVQIKSIEKSKPGKHGAAKARITAVGLFNNQKKTPLMGTT